MRGRVEALAPGTEITSGVWLSFGSASERLRQLRRIFRTLSLMHPIAVLCAETGGGRAVRYHALATGSSTSMALIGLPSESRRASHFSHTKIASWRRERLYPRRRGEAMG